MKRIIAVFLSLALLAGLLSGCQSDSAEAYVPTGDALVVEGQEVEQEFMSTTDQEMSLVYYPDRGMNPIFCTDYTNRVLFPLVYQSLFSVNRDGEVVPILCGTYTVSADMRAYEFTINPHATFSDGTPVTAADASSSLHAAWRSDYYGGRMTHVEYIYANDAGNLVIGMLTPFENLPLLLDIPIVKAAEVEAQMPLGSGPYVVAGIEGNRSLNRRTNWWCKSNDLLITAQRIPLREAASTTDVRDYFEFGDAGVVCTDPGSDWYAEYRCDYELWDCETGMLVYMGFNFRSGLFTDVAARQAAVRGVNRALLADKYYRGFASVAELPASPNSPYYSEALAQKYSYSEADFLNMMAPLGVQGRMITLLVNSDDSLRVKVAQEIGRMFNTSGLIIRITALETSEYMAALLAGEYDMYIAQTKLSPNMDLTPFFSESGALNYGGLASIDMYTYCLQAMENKGNYYTLHQAVMDQALICPIVFRSYAVYAARGLLTQMQPARDNLFFYTLA